jgi:hypothetical protein
MRSFRWTEATGMLALDPDGALQLGPGAMSASGDLLLGTAYLDGTRVRGLATWTPSQGIVRLLDPTGVASSTPFYQILG